MERGIDKRKLEKDENTEITLADEQHTQMCDVMNAIHGEGIDDLQKMFEGGNLMVLVANSRRFGQHIESKW